MITWKRLTKHTSLGIATMGLGASVFFAPLIVGEWIFALLGIVFIVAGFLQLILALTSDDRFSMWIPYVSAALCIAFGILVFASPSITMRGLLILFVLALIGGGAFRVYASIQKSGPDRWWSIANGLFTIILGILIYALVPADLGLIGIAVALGLWLFVEGWSMFFVPERDIYGEDVAPDPSVHPDSRLGLEPSETVRMVQEEQMLSNSVATSQYAVYSFTFIALFFTIHLLRTSADWTLLGIISPFAAVVGDVVVALLIGAFIVLPIRLFWRFLTRPIERAAWRRYEQLNNDGTSPSLLEKSLQYWLGFRLRFSLAVRNARYSANFALWRLMSLGIPVVAVLIAINSIWGFSWYFNSENWASAVWQEITKTRIDAWRQRAAEDVEKQFVDAGVSQSDIFAIKPEGIDDTDFAFVVIGDTGEGDPSQAVLRDQIIAAGKRPDVKFLLLSSDVIYPDGKMKDYERNFYLPFKGFDKPIYAIPGNHDWFDANEGFNANFLTPDAALTTSRARLLEDLHTDLISEDQRYLANIAEAKQLREYYQIDNGHQRAPFFEIHAQGFSLIAADTGILRRLDDKQFAWLEEALKRADTNFKMVVLGHPFYVAGRYTTSAGEDFEKIHELLKRYNVNVVMAGDTHDFEHYCEGEMLHFVNGGGGAYLSIGTSVAFPEDPDVPDFAYYPRGDAVNAKLDRETPFWKYPFLLWMRQLGGYPFDSEMVSGAFDFNSAPFFQSFVEVRVERSQNRVRFLLYGVNGPLSWRDIQASPSLIPPGTSPDSPAGFIAPLAQDQQ